ncbi:hypothetical protein RFN29_15125 [Mesorhizobium sp. VK22B]|uniref:Uncharacterized protein n=1 Tax=Mesorhizobium captivum TaxID=3072319 RepID=A0ABU4Z4A3_9HYPH|nr:hypothetical protein [Mesorhizobium sp. VK22B]MDX8492909.1 hypothetical protein [Mesorhizobium sp. VK22B]
MSAWACLCILLSLAFGAASVANYFCIDRQEVDRRVDAQALTVLLATGSLAAFILAIFFALAGAAQGLA